MVHKKILISKGSNFNYQQRALCVHIFVVINSFFLTDCFSLMQFSPNKLLVNLWTQPEMNVHKIFFLIKYFFTSSFIL